MIVKARRVRRVRRLHAPRLEALECRALLSTDTLSSAGASAGASGSIMLRFDANTTAAAEQAALGSVGGVVVENFPDGPEVVDLPAGVAPAAAAAKLEASPGVLYAEADTTLQTAAAATIPNDPVFSSEWGMDEIDAPEAWSVTTGSSSVIVAVLDTGIDLSNPDFTGHLWTNPSAGKDGYTGDVNGWNFVNNNGNVQDNNGHGSHVTGIIAAAGNNGYGIAGVAWNVQIMPVKILGADGSGTTQEAVAGIYFAVQHGAKVINASWGGSAYSQALYDAISYANSQGVVFVTAAGNDGVDTDASRNDYPADFGLPNELSVAAIDSSGNLASFSDYGASTVDLAAPGVNILSYVPGGYATYSGTSMATAFVSGVVSLVAGEQPGLGASQLVQRILATVKPLPSLAGNTVSGGVVDALNAVSGNGQQAQALPPSGADESFDQVSASILASDDIYKAFGGTPTGYVTGLYQVIFDRAPDPTGLAYYSGLITSGVSRQDVIQQLESFDEANRTLVARWYQTELGWDEPLPELKVDPGVEWWASKIDSGQGVDDVHAQVLAAGIAPGGTSADFVTGLYQSALGRAPDPTGLAYYTAQAQQYGRYSVALTLLTSDESRRTEIARLYQTLGRDAPLAELKVDSGVEWWASLMGGWS